MNTEHDFTKANVHDVFGNRMKNNIMINNKIIYDDSWQYDYITNLIILLIRPIWKFNYRLRKLGALNH